MEFNTNSKAHVLELIEKERMIGVMNNAKWNSLFEALNTIDELLSYRVTYIDGSTWPDAEASFPYTSELAQIWGNFMAMEYIDLDARIEHSKGSLLKPKIIDHKQKVIELCTEQKAKFSITENGIRVWGYFRHGHIPELYENT
jgi:hypothetical protein